MDTTCIELGNQCGCRCGCPIKKAHDVIAINDWHLGDEEWCGGYGADGERLLVCEFTISGGNQPLPLGDGQFEGDMSLGIAGDGAADCHVAFSVFDG